MTDAHDDTHNHKIKETPPTSQPWRGGGPPISVLLSAISGHQRIHCTLCHYQRKDLVHMMMTMLLVAWMALYAS